MDSILTVATVLAAIRLAIPVALAALGALINERAGVLNLGLEGMMLSGALSAYLTTVVWGSPWFGLFGGLLTGALVGTVFALLVLTARANQMVTGIVVTLLAVGFTTYIFRRVYGLGETPPSIPRLDVPVLVAVVVGAVGIVWFVLTRTTAGLALSATGESPAAVDALGYRVSSIRWMATIAGGSLAGLGGAALVCGPLGRFTENVTFGRGWVALALVVFARWQPVAAAAGALLFGLCDAIQFRLQGSSTLIPSEAFIALPYVVTLAVLALRARTRAAPRALGEPYVRGAQSAGT